MKRFFNIALAGAALMVGLTLVPNSVQAQDRQDRQAAATYHDKKGNDDHQWNDRENQAYRIYQRDNHRKEVEFGKLRDRDQQTYWNWRHKHSDAELKIDIR
jgi:hypothetical protein